MRPAGFEPAYPAWKAGVLTTGPQTRIDRKNVLFIKIMVVQDTDSSSPTGHPSTNYIKYVLLSII